MNENIDTSRIEKILRKKYGWDHFPLPIIRIPKQITKKVVQLIEFKKKKAKA
tara:strand:- start:299 stop:454 length:156 start_codon:yes stop_codon:yes gene_type:complete